MTSSPSTSSALPPTAAAPHLPGSAYLPPYQRVAAELRQQIRSGRLRPGDRIPGSRAIEDRYKIANMTARSAVRVLRDEGLIHTTVGRGSFVADPLPPAPDFRLPSTELSAMPTAEYVELSRRLDELTEAHAALHRHLAQVGGLAQPPV